MSKNMALWVLTVLLLLAAVALFLFLPGIWGFIALGLAAVFVPIPGWQALLSKSLQISIRTLTLAALTVLVLVLSTVAVADALQPHPDTMPAAQTDAAAEAPTEPTETDPRGTVMTESVPAPTPEVTTLPATAPTPAAATQPTTEPTPQGATAPPTEVTTSPQTEPTAEATPAPPTEPAPEVTTVPAAEPTTAPTAEPVTEPVAKPTAAPTAEPEARPPVQTAPETEPTAEPPADPGTAPLGLSLDGEDREYILNTKSKKFHDPDCGSVKQMKEENKESYTGSREDLLGEGYTPCGRCKP